MPRKSKVYVSTIHDPSFNMAFESYLLKNNTPDTIIFFLWQNAKTIVIGRHQNPYNECNIESVKHDGVSVVRRLSGGGAVYHDLGNLNFTFIAGQDDYNVEKQCGVIVETLKAFNIDCEVSGRNDMTIQGAKFSGHAYMMHDEMHCHHGTLLIDSDLELLSKYLQVSKLKLKSKGVESVRSRVVNLSKCYRDSEKGKFNVETLSKALIETFLKQYPWVAMVEQVGIDCNHLEVMEEMKRFKTWDWNVSESMEFDVSYEEKFRWGVFDVRFNCLDGVITKCDLSTDCILEEDFKRLEMDLVGTFFKKSEMNKCVHQCLNQEEIKSDLSNWFDRILFDN